MFIFPRRIIQVKGFNLMSFSSSERLKSDGGSKFLYGKSYQVRAIEIHVRFVFLQYNLDQEFNPIQIKL